MMTSIRFHRLYSLKLCLVAIFFPLVSYAIAPITPDNFHYKIYSNTAAELFWLRSTNVAVQGYEITRNGDILGVFDALSYFDDTLGTGVDYTYTVTAVGFDGERSVESTVTLRTPQYADTIVSLQREIDSLESEINTLESQLNDGIRAPVPQTGQMISYLSGDDGDWQAGVEPPDPRFTDNNDGTFTDNLTGLVWLSIRDCIVENIWSSAISVASLQTGDGTTCGGLTDGSEAGDWRLPNLNELQSLLDYSTFSPALAKGIPFRGQWDDFPWDGYWTSTTLSIAPDQNVAWAVYIDLGHLTTRLKPEALRGWPVRNRL